MTMTLSPNIQSLLIVPGLPHLVLAPERSKSWKLLRESLETLRKEVIDPSGSNLILYYSTQWISVIGHLTQGDRNPQGRYVDPNWHELGSMDFSFQVDTEFAKAYVEAASENKLHMKSVCYEGFPIDPGVIVAQKLLNPGNKIPSAMVSCNIYSDRKETELLGLAAAQAISKLNRKVIVVLVSSLSSRFSNTEIDPTRDVVSTPEGDTWNRRICSLLSEGKLGDVAELAHEFGQKGQADMGFKGVWWLNALAGNQNQQLAGRVLSYEPVWGSGNAVVNLTPIHPVQISIPPNANTASRSHIFDSLSAAEPVGPYPHARREGDFLFLSGIGPRVRGSTNIPGVQVGADGAVLNYDIEAQTRSTLDNVRKVLTSAGLSFDDVVDVQVFLTDIKRDFAAFNRIYAEYLGSVRPTRTTIGVTGLPTPIAVELKVTARFRS